MSENYIVINGKKAELTPEQLKALGIEVKKPNLFDMQEYHYYISSYGDILMTKRTDGFSFLRHRIANYCTDKALLQQRAYHETLNRLLWRFSMENGGDKIDWSDNKYKYNPFYNHHDNNWGVECHSICHHPGGVYFATEETAERAIEEIIVPFMKDHPDFKL